jgi:hypothetical protein
MNFKLTLINRIFFTAIVTLLSWAHLAWDYFHGGIPTHYLLHRRDLPGISNWWGGIVIPLLTWFLLYRIKRRVYDKDINEVSNTPNHAIYGFFGALLFGILLSFFFAIGTDVPGYLMIGLFIISFFIPIYRAEHLLGFVLGMAYTFGGILPIVIGSILVLIFMIDYRVVGTFIHYLISKTTSGKS